jgi:chromosomal replication initiator protein
MRVKYVSSEKFTNDLINAIRDSSNEDFRNRYRTIDILMIDDIQFIAGKDSTQEEFFHTFNALHGAGKQIVISSDRPPKAILTLEDRLRSRFEGGLIADIQPPDLETRTAILRAKGDSQQIPIPSEVIDYVAHKVQSNIRELEGALNRIIAFAMLNHKPLTVDVAALALIDLAANNRRRQITPARVVETVASFYSMDIDDLKAKSRSRDIVVPRQIAMYIIREETDTSLTDIGAEFGNRDHTTVMHACEKIEKAKETDNQIRQAVLAIRQMLYGEIMH